MKRPWVIPLLLGLVLLDVLLVRWWLGHRREIAAERAILNAAWRYNMDPALIKAVVWRESRFDPKAKGRVGEIGLMQVGQAAAKEWAESEHMTFFLHSELYNPNKNALAGTWYLKKVLQRYSKADNPIPYALADYNAGRSNVLRWTRGAAATNSAAFIRAIDFPTTRQYVESIMARYEIYRQSFPGKRAGATAARLE